MPRRSESDDAYRAHVGEDSTGRKKFLHCSFCRTSQKYRKKLIAGPAVYICDECIDLCSEILAEETRPALWKNLHNQLAKLRAARRGTSHTLPEGIHDFDLPYYWTSGIRESLPHFIDEISRESGIRFHHDMDEIDLPRTVSIRLFHIASEGVMNAVKHADATDVWIAVTDANGDIVLEVRDNGIGFDTAAPVPAERLFAIANMHDLAGGGTVAIKSVHGEGTTITVRFPSSVGEQ